MTAVTSPAEAPATETPATETPAAETPAESEALPPVGRKRGALHVLRVAALERLTDDAVAITLAVPPALREEFSYLPGQHVAVRATIAGDDVRRNYSICSPAGSTALRIGVKRLPDGVFSGYALGRLVVGDSLEVLAPSGGFTVTPDPARSRNIGAIAAGSGITPVLSILASVLAAEPESTATLIYANRNTASIMFLEDLADLKNRYLDRFTMYHVLGQEHQDVELLSGRLDPQRLSAILDDLVQVDIDEWFLCGPIELTDMVRETLRARSVPDDRIRRELFHALATPPRRPLRPADESSPDACSVTVRLDGRGTSFKLPRDTESILDAALRLRSELPYACKNGVCGTCRCRLVTGEVEMAQNFALEQDELDRGYRLACQSYPVTDTVVIDFDQ